MWHRLKRFATLETAFATIFALCVPWFLSGIVRFPDAPFRPCGEERYCGKWGVPHTAAEFEAFKFWETSIMIIWPILIVVGFAFEARRRWRPNR